MKYRTVDTLWHTLLFILSCLAIQLANAVEFDDAEVNMIEHQIKTEKQSLQHADGGSGSDETDTIEKRKVLINPSKFYLDQAFSQYNEALITQGIATKQPEQFDPETKPPFYSRAYPFKKKVTELTSVHDLASYMQLGHQIYRYRSTFQACLIKNDQDSELFNETSPLLHHFAVKKPAWISENSRLNALCADYIPQPLTGTPEGHEEPTSFPWGSYTANHFSQLGQLKGVPPKHILSLSELIESNTALLSNETTGADTFSGMNTLYTTLFSVLSEVGAIPVSISDLDPAQQHAMLAVFLQGSAAYSWQFPESIQSMFKMKSLSKDTSGPLFILKNLSPKAKKLTESIHYDSYYLIDTAYHKLERPQKQLIWLGFYGKKLYFGAYPTEGLLLAYEIEAPYQRAFVARLYGLLGIISTTFTSSVPSLNNELPALDKITASQRPVLQETFIAEPTTSAAKDETDGPPKSIEFSYAQDGSFNVKITNLPEEEEEALPAKSGTGACGLCHFCSCITGLCTKSAQLCNLVCNKIKGLASSAAPKKKVN